MAKTTVTLELGGRVEIEQLQQGIALFHRLITGLTPRGAGVVWVVEDLQPGSASATLRGEAADLAAIERIVEGYEYFGATLSRDEETPDSPPAMVGGCLVCFSGGVRVSTRGDA